MKYKITNGAVTLGSNIILEEINFEINDREKVAIVGRNGSGKTTFLRALIDNSLLEEGVGDTDFKISRLGDFKIGYLKQIAFDDEEETMYEEVLKAVSDIRRIEKEIQKYENEKDLSDEKVLNSYLDLRDEYEIKGGYGYKKEIEILLKKFGFEERDKKKKLKEFSGGQKTKISFVKLLLSKPDLLLLDEPTNNLDILTIEWLEEYLRDYPKAIILVSHDRMFLNNIVNVVYEIEYGTLEKYLGNYSYYEKEKKLRYDKRFKDYEYQEKEIKRLESIYERFRYKPTKAKMAKAKLKQIERIRILDKPSKGDEKVFRMNLDKIDASGRVVLKLKKLSFGYDRELGNISLELERGERLGIIGSNGKGKSSLAKTIAGLIPRLGGKIEFGVNVQMGYFDQNLVFDNSEISVYDEFRDMFPRLTETEVRTVLGSFLFTGDDVFKKIGDLSGGEKVRLKLCEILYNRPNLLLLDEPTNHMDIMGKSALESILEEYKGTIIFVSHDRYFVNKIASCLLVFEEEGVDYYKYGYDDYLRKRNKKEKEEAEEKKEIRVDKIVRNEKEIVKLEKKIIKIEEEIKLLSNKLMDNNIYSDYEEVKKVNERLIKLEKEKSLLEDEWEKYMV